MRLQTVVLTLLREENEGLVRETYPDTKITNNVLQLSGKHRFGGLDICLSENEMQPEPFLWCYDAPHARVT